MLSTGSWTGAFIFLGCMCAVCGWALIEFVLWLFSFVSVSIG